jgi:hypothetical protein
MIGDRYVIEATIRCENGPEIAGVILTEAAERVGWLWICHDESCNAMLLPGEAQAFIDGTRPVACLVSLIVQTMQYDADLGVAMMDEVMRELDADDRATCDGISVAVYLRATEPLKEN